MYNRAFIVALLAICLHSASSTVCARPLPDTITYQGELKVAGAPADGLYDFKFRLYSFSTQVGVEVCANDVPVTGGRFTVLLNFGAGYQPTQYNLEIDVRADTGLPCNDATGFTTLAPRQQLTAALQAQLAVTSLFAQSAGSADSASSVGSIPASNVATLSGNQTFSGTASFTNAGGVSVQSGTVIDADATNTGTLADGLRFGGAASDAGIASKRTAGGNQNGLDLFTGGVSRMQIGSDGKVGIGVSGSTPGVIAGANLVVVTSEANAPGLTSSSAIRGRHDGLSDAPNNPFGVYGQQRAGSGFLPLHGAGVYGSSDVHSGVVGFSSGDGTAGTDSRGVYGHALNDLGSGVGVVGRSDGDAGIGVLGQALSIDDQDVTVGVWGVSEGAMGVGVRAESIVGFGSPKALHATVGSPSGYAGYFEGGMNYFQGSVGVGTSAPAAPLHVVGMIQATGLGPSGSSIAFNSPTGAPGVSITRGNGGGGPQRSWDMLVDTDSTFRLRDDSAGATRLTVDTSGRLGVGEAAPLSLLHVASFNLGLTTASLENDEVIIEGDDAAMGLYSTEAGVWGSAIAFKELTAGTLVNTWGIARQTTGSGSSLRFTFGTSDNYASNNSVMTILPTGEVGIGVNAPTARLQVQGHAVITGTLSKGGGSFKIDHPLDPENKYLYHSFVESPDMMNVYNGNVTTEADGYATVTLPDYFEALNRDFRYQLTVLNEDDTGEFLWAQVVRKINGNQFTIRTSRGGVEVSWQVTGIRHDAFAEKNRIPGAVEKSPAERGKYMHPEAFGLPAEKSIYFDAQPRQAGATR